MSSIQVPEYVEADFKKRLGPIIAGNPNATEQSLQRIYRLIAQALESVENVGWVVDGTEKYSSSNWVEPYGLERFNDSFIVYAEERGSRGVLAIFKSPDLAAE